MSLNVIHDQFQTQFGQAPHWIVRAPGRVNLIGEHTDYNDGFVLPMAIDYEVQLAAAPAENANASMIRLHSQSMNETVEILLTGSGRSTGTHWSLYFEGVVHECQGKGLNIGPIDVLMTSTVPVGGGLSSSAAVEVATATLIEAITGESIDPIEKAYLCQRAEHHYAGVPCGIMDQFSSALGKEEHLLLLDCRSASVELVPFADPSITVLIINSNVRHELTGGEYAERRQQCHQSAEILGVKALRDVTLEQLETNKEQLTDVQYRRARHVISENTRVLQFVEALKAKDWLNVGKLMLSSHESLRDDYEVSCRELDLLVEIALQQEGVIGSRLTGGGFGGCTVSLVRADAVDSVIVQISAAYLKKTGIEATCFTTRPASGASKLEG